MLKYTTVLLLSIFSVSSIAASSTTIFTTRQEFTTAAGTQLQVEDWSTYQPDTILEGITLRGVTYHSTSSELLLIGAPSGPNWLFGYARGGGQYASLSNETISFSFSEPVIAIGIALSQGNSSGSNSYTGSSEWQVGVDSGLGSYKSVATYTSSDFTGEAYLGILDISPSTTFSVTRLRSDANVVWDIRDIAWISVSAEPELSAALFGISGLVLIYFCKRRRKSG
jgi:hypothetical protein